MKASTSQKIMVPTKKYDGGSSETERERLKCFTAEKHFDAFSYYSNQGQVGQSILESQGIIHRVPADIEETQPRAELPGSRRTRISFELHPSLVLAGIGMSDADL
jgi:hypothetical protein